MTDLTLIMLQCFMKLASLRQFVALHCLNVTSNAALAIGISDERP